ncbi:MAG: hypothetical protein L0Z70_04210 [Chloroflexi bacterium]|nr:hypothetical protein [Chloroflexota bacterium]
MDKPKFTLPDWFWPVLGRALLILFVGALTLSFGYETALPLYREGNYRALIFNVLGFPIILLATGVFVYSGLVFLAYTYALMESEDFHQRAEVGRHGRDREARRQAQRENLRALWEAWKPGLRWLGLGIVLFVLGSYIMYH